MIIPDGSNRLECGTPIFRDRIFLPRGGILDALPFLPRLMPVSTQAPARRRRPTSEGRPVAARVTALMVIDHERLQSAAWAEFHTARKRLDKAARDLHRHEEEDVPAFTSWFHRTFPLLITRLRELHEEVATKARKVQAAQLQAAYAGGSLKRIWREQKEREANPEPIDDAQESRSRAKADDETGGWGEDPWSDDVDVTFGLKPSRTARDIYRRLVQQLHPDRGGKWTEKRQHLWHEVQQAWSAADADWLARLEIEWETANEIIGPTSPLSRLRQAIKELHAARRDTERKLRSYRTSPEWRFTKTEKTRSALHHRVEMNFAHDLDYLQRQLDYLNATIAAWEEDWTRPKNRPKPKRSRGKIG